MSIPPAKQTLVEEYLADSIGFITRSARQYGDAVPLPFHAAKRMLWIVSDPTTVQEILTKKSALFRKGHSYRRAKAIVGEGLFTSDGELHRRHRRLANPFFQAEEIRRYGDLMIDIASQVVGSWSSGQGIDVCAEMSRLTLAVVARALFGADLLTRAPQLAKTLTELLALLHEQLRPIEVGQPRVAPEEGRRFARLRAVFDEAVFAMIQERRASSKNHGEDLFDRLLSASEEGAQGFDDHELRDELVTLLISGHDTTGVTVSFALWLLAANPDIRARAEEEVDRVLAGRLPTFEDAPRFTLLGQVFYETLRLYPPVWLLAREALSDVELPALTVKKGDSVCISLFVLHRDPRWWTAPLSFRPERFAPGAPPPAPGTYLPFGAGLRTCIGRSFAALEGILVLAMILQRVRIEIDTSREPRLLSHMLVRPAGGIPGVVRSRSRA